MEQTMGTSKWLIIKEYLKLIALWKGIYVGYFIFWIPLMPIIQQVPERKINAVKLPKLPFEFYTILLELLSIGAIVFIVYSLKHLWEKSSIMKVHLYVLTVLLSLNLLFWFHIMLTAPLLIMLAKLIQ